MNVVRQTPTELIVHEGALKTVLVGVIFVAVGGGFRYPVPIVDWASQ